MIAGLGVVFKTGFAGLSAAVAIVWMLIIFLPVNAYDAVGTALASHVPASDLTGSVSHFVIGGGVTDYSILFYTSSLRCLALYIPQNLPIRPCPE